MAGQAAEQETGVNGIPVVADADVVVIGAGPGGFAAALRARREGCSVVVVEKFDMPGGVHTSGLQGAANVGVGGIHTELMERFDREGCIYTADERSLPDWAGNALSHYDYYLPAGSPFKRVSFNPDGAGNVMIKMLEEAGVQAISTVPPSSRSPWSRTATSAASPTPSSRPWVVVKPFGAGSSSKDRAQLKWWRVPEHRSCAAAGGSRTRSRTGRAVRFQAACYGS